MNNVPDSKQFWPLEGFLDALILELDKAQDTLSIKGVTRKLTYTVKDLALDLHIFPDFSDGDLRFANARPGEEGASRISFQLGSITDRQIRDVANPPASRDDVVIADIEGVTPEVKRSLQRVGVTRASDLERMEREDVDIEKVVNDKSRNTARVDYSNLAKLINQAKRRINPPAVSELSARTLGDGRQLELSLQGKALAVDPGHWPVAHVNGLRAEVVSATPGKLQLQLDARSLHRGDNTLEVVLDEYAVVQLSIKG